MNNFTDTSEEIKAEILAVQVVRLDRLEHATVRAVASVRIGPITVHGCKVVCASGKEPFVSLPQEKSRNGEWKPIVEASRECRDAIQAAVLREYQRRWRFVEVPAEADAPAN